MASHINPTGGASISALSDIQALELFNKLRAMLTARRQEIRREWEDHLADINPVKDPEYASKRQLDRLAEVAVDGLKSPIQVEAMLKSKFHIDSLAFAIPRSVMNGMLNILESYRSKHRQYRYKSGKKAS